MPIDVSLVNHLVVDFTESVLVLILYLVHIMQVVGVMVILPYLGWQLLVFLFLYVIAHTTQPVAGIVIHILCVAELFIKRWIRLFLPMLLLAMEMYQYVLIPGVVISLMYVDVLGQ